MNWQIKQEDLIVILDILRKILITGNEKELFQRYITLKNSHQIPLEKDDVSAMIRFDDFDLYKSCYQQAIALFPLEETLSLLINSTKLEFYNHQDIMFMQLMPTVNKFSLTVEAKSNAFILYILEHEKLTEKLALKCLIDAAKKDKVDVFNLILDKIQMMPNGLLNALLSDDEINQGYLYKILSKTNVIDMATLQTALERGNNRLAADIYLKAVEQGNHLDLSQDMLHCLSDFIAIGHVATAKKISI